MLQWENCNCRKMLLLFFFLDLIKESLGVVAGGVFFGLSQTPSSRVVAYPCPLCTLQNTVESRLS